MKFISFSRPISTKKKLIFNKNVFRPLFPGSGLKELITGYLCSSSMSVMGFSWTYVNPFYKKYKGNYQNPLSFFLSITMGFIFSMGFFSNTLWTLKQMSPSEWKILEWYVKPQTNKLSNKLRRVCHNKENHFIYFLKPS